MKGNFYMNVQDKFAAFRDAVVKFAPEFKTLADGPEWLLLWYREMNADLDFTDVVDLKLTSKPSHVPRQEFSVRFHHKSPDSVLISYLVEDPDSFFEADREWRSVGLDQVESTLRFMLGKFRTLVDKNAAVDLVAATKRRMSTNFFWRYRHDPDAVESSWICNPSPNCRAELVNIGGRDEWEVTLARFDGDCGLAFTTIATDLHESEVIAKLEPVLTLSYEQMKSLGKAGFTKLFES